MSRQEIRKNVTVGVAQSARDVIPSHTCTSALCARECTANESVNLNRIPVRGVQTPVYCKSTSMTRAAVVFVDHTSLETPWQHGAALWLSLAFAAVLIAVVSWMVARKQQCVEVKVRFNRQTFRLPDTVTASDAEEARNVMILLMKALGIIPAAAARQPSMTKPKADFLVTGPGDATLDVVNVKKTWRGPMAVALGVSQDVLNSTAYITCTKNVTVDPSTDFSQVSVQQQVQGGWDILGRWKVNPRMFQMADHNILLCKQKHDTLFTAFALVHPRSFDGCIWDARQHAQEHAEPGLMLDYEYMPYQQYLRRRAVLYICQHWPQFEHFVKAEHGPGISTAADYLQLMLYKYSNTALLTESLALCDMFGCAAEIVDGDTGTYYNLFPRNAPISSGPICLLRLGSVYHVLLPTSTTNVDLPASLPPDIVSGSQARRMVTAGAVLWGRSPNGLDETVQDAVPPVCLAMPPRAIEGPPRWVRASLRGDPPSWAGPPDINMFSFAFGTYFGLAPYMLGYDPYGSNDPADSSCSGMGETARDSSNGLDSGDGTGTSSNADDTPVVTIPLAEGGICVARFMASAYFDFMTHCWQCGGVWPGMAGLFYEDQVCACTSCRCGRCTMHLSPTWGCRTTE